MGKEIPIPVLGAGLGLIGGSIDAIAQSEANRKNRKWSEMMAQRGREWALADFHMQNEYNSPAAQMARLKAAGLNPNLVYGTGAATSSAQPVRSTNIPQGTNRSTQPGQALTNSIGSYIQLKSMDADIDLKKNQQMLNLVEMVLKGKQGRLLDTEEASKAFDLRMKERLADTTVSAAEAQLKKTLADTQFTLDANQRANALQAPTITKLILEAAKIRIDNARTQEEILEIREKVKHIIADTRLKNADADLKEAGIQPHDSMFWRNIGVIFKPEVITKEEYEKLPSFMKKLIDPSKIKK